MTDYNRANVHLEVAKVPSDKNEVEQQITEILKEYGMEVEACHVERMKYPVED